MTHRSHPPAACLVRRFLPVALALLGPARCLAENPAPALDGYNVAWNTPSADSAGSMPLGNGDIALNAWVEKNGDLVFYIAKSDAWSGDLTTPSYGAYGLIKVGRVRVSLSPNPFAGAADFNQELRLRDGTFTVSAGHSKLSLWVDANRPVIHVENSCATPVRMKVALESWRTAATEYLAADTIVPGRKNQIVWYYKGLNKEIPQLVDRTIGAAITGDGLVSQNALTLVSRSPATTQLVAIHPLTAQCPAQDAWLAKLDRQIATTTRTPLDAARKEHQDWWTRFWDRSHIYITGGEKAREVTQGYILQRFKNACTSRGEFPIKFNGSLFTVENPKPVVVKDKAKLKPDITIPVTADYRGWGYQYWFQNTRPMYWPMMASGDFDLMRPLFRMYAAQIPVNAKLVREYYHHDGAYFRETGPFWGGIPNITPKEGGNYTKHYYTPVLELSAMMLDYFAYTEDKEFVQNTLLPVADAGVTFFDQHFPRDPKGKLLLDPDNAIEMFWKVRNPLPDIAGLRYVLRGLLNLPADLTTPAARQRWQRLLAEIPPVPTGTRDGKPQLLPFEDGQNQGRHNLENPELYAIYPFRLYGLDKPDIDTARNAFAARKFKRAGCWSQEAVQAALLGDAATGMKYVTGHLTRKDRRMRFPAFWDKGSDYVPDEDNGGNGLHALQTMLLQFHGDKLLLLPAWPKTWDADFKLRAPRQTTVEGSIRNGKLLNLKVTPADRRKDIVVMEPQ